MNGRLRSQHNYITIEILKKIQNTLIAKDSLAKKNHTNNKIELSLNEIIFEKCFLYKMYFLYLCYYHDAVWKYAFDLNVAK